MEKNEYNNIAIGTAGDVRISYKDYLMMIDYINDSGLTSEGLWRFRLLWQVNFYGILFTPFLSLAGAWVLNRIIIGPVNKGTAMSKLKYPMYTLTLPIIAYFLYSKPLPKRLYTQVIASDDDDAAYIRQEISKNMPGFWHKLSSQLHRLGYDYPEMIEYSQRTEFGQSTKSM